MGSGWCDFCQMWHSAGCGHPSNSANKGGVFMPIDDLEAENAALRSELLAFKESYGNMHSDCHELIKQNAALQAQVEEMREFLACLSRRKCTCVHTFIRSCDSCKAQALLASPPAGDMVCVKKEDLEIYLHRNAHHAEEIEKAKKHLKAALGKE